MEKALFRRVLVPHDFSAAADAALRTAAALVARDGGRLLVLHAITPFLAPKELAFATPPALGGTDLEDAVLARLRARVRRVAPRAEARCEVVTGNPWQRILAASADASCIVVGTAGRTGFAHALLGSVAERVVRLSPVPVLTVRHRPGRARRRRGAVKRRR